MQEKSSLKPALWLLLYVYFLRTLVPYFADLLGFSLTQNQNVICIQLIGVLLPGIVYLIYTGVPPAEVLRCRMVPLPALIRLFLMGVATQTIAMLLNLPLLYVAEKILGEVPSSALTATDEGGLMSSIFWIALIPAVVEEFLMRGIMVQAYQKRGYRISLLLIGFFFALLHGRTEELLGLFFLGVLLTWAVYATDSLLAAIVLHFGFNVGAILLEYLQNTWSVVYPFLGGYGFFIIQTIVSVIIFGWAAGSFRRRKKQGYPSVDGTVAESFGSLPLILVLAAYLLSEITYFI